MHDSSKNEAINMHYSKYIHLPQKVTHFNYGYLEFHFIRFSFFRYLFKGKKLYNAFKSFFLILLAYN